MTDNIKKFIDEKFNNKIVELENKYGKYLTNILFDTYKDGVLDGMSLTEKFVVNNTEVAN